MSKVSQPVTTTGRNPPHTPTRYCDLSLVYASSQTASETAQYVPYALTDLALFADSEGRAIARRHRYNATTPQRSSALSHGQARKRASLRMFLRVDVAVGTSERCYGGPTL